MTSSRTPAIGTPTAAWVLLAVVVGLSLQVAAAPDIGVPLIALALLAAGFVIFVLASSELERDVVHMALLGAVLGGAGEAWLLGTQWWHGALFGLLVGGLIGDEIQLSRKWLKLTRFAKAETRWWQRSRPQLVWLPRIVWSCAAGLFVVAVGLLVMYAPHVAGQSSLLPDWLEVFRERRLQSPAWMNMAHTWFALVALAISVALSRFVARVPDQQVLVEGLMRQIAVLQCAALLMLAFDGTLRSQLPFGMFGADSGEAAVHALESLADTVRLIFLPLGVLLLAQFYLGKRLFHYWQRSGWIVAMGLCSLAGVMALQFCIALLLTIKV